MRCIPPGDSGNICRVMERGRLLCLRVFRRLVSDGTCPPPGGLEAVASSCTCPLLGDLADVSPSYWTLKGDLQGL